MQIGHGAFSNEFHHRVLLGKQEPVLSLRPPCLKIIKKYSNSGISFFVVVVFPWLEKAVLYNMHGISFQIL